MRGDGDRGIQCGRRDGFEMAERREIFAGRDEVEAHPLSRNAGLREESKKISENLSDFISLKLDKPEKKLYIRKAVWKDDAKKRDILDERDRLSGIFWMNEIV